MLKIRMFAGLFFMLGIKEDREPVEQATQAKIEEAIEVEIDLFMG
jgi:hypothetical protein